MLKVVISHDLIIGAAQELDNIEVSETVIIQKLNL